MKIKIVGYQNKKERNVCMKAFNILWDVDCKKDLFNLPTEVQIPDNLKDEEEISDYLSDLTGFCHRGFMLKT